MFIRSWHIERERYDYRVGSDDHCCPPRNPDRRLTLEMDVSPYELDAFMSFIRGYGGHVPEPEYPHQPELPGRPSLTDSNRRAGRHLQRGHDTVPALQDGIIDAEFVDD